MLGQWPPIVKMGWDQAKKQRCLLALVETWEFSQESSSEYKAQQQIVDRGDSVTCVSSFLIISFFSRNIKQDAKRFSAENEVGENRIGLRIED